MCLRALIVTIFLVSLTGVPSLFGQAGQVAKREASRLFVVLDDELCAAAPQPENTDPIKIGEALCESLKQALGPVFPGSTIIKAFTDPGPTAADVVLLPRFVGFDATGVLPFRKRAITGAGVYTGPTLEYWKKKV
jgi:hypothetical protein